MIKKLLYLGYYIKGLDRKKFNSFLNYTATKTGTAKTKILIDILKSVFKYNISILEYFQFNFLNKNHEERLRWAGTGFMYEYQLMMNPKSERDILDDKRKFHHSYKKYFVHSVASLDELKSNSSLVDRLLNNPSGKMVFKAANGKCGLTVEVVNTIEYNQTSMISHMEEKGLELVEEYIIQHPELNKLSPSGVNTVRIFTELDKNQEVVILGCRQRISVNSSVDNMAAGNIAAFIDENTGKIIDAGVYSDITKKEEKIHPVTGVSIIGFQVPFWQETLQMVKEAAKLHPQNRSIGWDIVISEKGPGFIEGNHDWCKLLWQLPAKKGLKSLLTSNL